MHRVLRISTDNAFCLHSKERVPYHIVIEVAYDPDQDRADVVSDSIDTIDKRSKIPKSSDGIWSIGKKIAEFAHNI